MDRRAGELGAVLQHGAVDALAVVALAAEGVDISESSYDGDDSDPGAQEKLDYLKSLAFEKFTLEPG